MKFRLPCNENTLLWQALGLSVILHFLLFHIGNYSLHWRQKNQVEIDISAMGRLGLPGDARKTISSPSRPKLAPQKEWVKSAQPVIPTAEEPLPLPILPTPSNSEYEIGTGGATGLTRIPQLLNLSDLNAILKRFYPEDARAQHRESIVVLDLHIDTEGHVQAVDVVRSGGSDFDKAAQRAAVLFRFTPAFLASQRVAVKMRQAIQFKLDE